MSAQFLVSVIVILVVVHLILLSCAYLIFLERKVASWVQDRIGPNRTNFSFGQDNIWRFLKLDFMNTRRFAGLGQALADGLKLLLKEDYTPPHVDRGLFLLAPVAVVVPALLGWAVMPWGGYFEFPGLDLSAWLGEWFRIEPGIVSVAAAPIGIGVIYVLAVSSLAVYGVTLAGYASNNKYSFLGGLRATAQMLSYEIPMGLIVLVCILSYGIADAGQIVVLQSESGWWGIFMHPLLAAIFFTCILAECNRAPFDLAEAEQELVGGFHTEYSSMKWALFFLGEYMHMITGCAFFTLLFLGGWDIPVLPIPAVGGLGLVLLKFVVFMSKVGFLLFFMMWVRWTLPRFRFDQLMKLAWRSLIPLCLLVLLVIGTLVYLQMPKWTYLLANIAVTAAALFISPMLPKGPNINRRLPLEGSRFYPPQSDSV